MSTPNENYSNISNCFSELKISDPKNKQETIQESIKDNKQFMVNFFKKQPYYNELMPKIIKASRGIVFYKGLIKKGVKHKSVFFEAIIRSIKRINEDKIQIRPRSKKKIRLYKLPKIEELKIKKDKIENIGKKKIKLIQLQNDKIDKYKNEVKKISLPAKTISKKTPIVYSTNTINFPINNNNRYMQNIHSTNNSFNKNRNFTSKFDQNYGLSPISKDISTYYKSNDTFKNFSKNGLFSNRLKPLGISKSSSDLNVLLEKCEKEIINGKEVEELVLNSNSNFIKSMQEIIAANRFINRDKKVLEDKKKDNKYIKLEEKNYANIKRKMKEKISDNLAYKNRKELREILKVNENARSYILQLNEMNKLNEKLSKRRVFEWKRIDKVNSMCDDEFRKKEYLKNRIDIINDKNDKLNKSIDNMVNEEFNVYKNNKDYMMGNLIPKLMTIKKNKEYKNVFEI